MLAASVRLRPGRHAFQTCSVSRNPAFQKSRARANEEKWQDVASRSIDRVFGAASVRSPSAVADHGRLRKNRLAAESHTNLASGTHPAQQRASSLRLLTVPWLSGTAADSKRTPAAAAQAAPVKASKSPLGNGALVLLALNFAIFGLDKLLHLSWVPQLYFWGAKSQWWQYVTASLCHANFAHLSNNMFMLYVFGKTVEDEEGALALIFSYFFCAIGGCLASAWLAPKTALVGASGACFGLFIVAAVLKLKFSWRALIELAAIAPFVYQQVTSNIGAQLSGGIGNISHVGHLGGAAAGLLLVGLLSLLPADEATA